MLAWIRNLKHMRVNLPSALPTYPVMHGVEYRSNEAPLPVPGFEEQSFRSRCTSLRLDPQQHGSYEALTAHMIREFRVVELPGHRAVIYWCNGPPGSGESLNELTPSAPVKELIMAEHVYFLFVYIHTS